MEVASMFLTHIAAEQQSKSPFFFSRFNFSRMRKRGNTHYCFHCGGQWGFRLDEDGNHINCEDTNVSLFPKDGEFIKNREALVDSELMPFLANEDGWRVRTPEDHDYKEWLNWNAEFTFCPELEGFARARNYDQYRYNPMKDHDPETHSKAVIGGADKYDDVWKWLSKTSYPNNFPYVVNVPSIW